MGKLSSFSDALLEDSAELSFIDSPAGEGSGPAKAEDKARVEKPEVEAQPPVRDPAEPTPVTEEAPPATAETPTAAPVSKPSKTTETNPTKKLVAKPAAKKRTPALAPEPEVPAVSDKARWTQLQRKEFRMHNVQADLLATLTRKVNRMSPRDPEERVTDNTLIRVGLALLLELHKDDLRGKNERELRESVGLPPELPDED